MIARIAIGHRGADVVKKLTDNDYGKLYGRMPELFPENRERFYYGSEDIIDLQTDGIFLQSFGIEFEIKKLKGLVAVGEIIPTLGGPIHVHVPNIGLMTVDQVMLKEDCCTDELQQELNVGWRILCICPPNSARRPDYILGRTMPEDEQDLPKRAHR